MLGARRGAGEQALQGLPEAELDLDLNRQVTPTGRRSRRTTCRRQELRKACKGRQSSQQDQVTPRNEARSVHTGNQQQKLGPYRRNQSFLFLAFLPKATEWKPKTLQELTLCGESRSLPPRCSPLLPPCGW